MLTKLFPWLRAARQLNLDRAFETLVLVSGENASLAYLVEPYLALRDEKFTIIDVNTADMKAVDWPRYKQVVIVRYLPPLIITALKAFHEAGGSIVYFMDDDLMDPTVLTTLPKPYGRKIQTRAIAHRRFLESICCEYWVSTSYLAEKYAAWSPKLLAPSANIALLSQRPRITVCYHGTTSHQTELRWLANVIVELQQHTEDLNFEIFGDMGVNRLYRDLPRVTVIYPMSWRNYVDFTSSVVRDIALAPLLPNEFNAARGPTKFFDFTRMRAAGIYSDTPPYRGFIRDGIDGILVANTSSAWIEAITDLAKDREKREGIAKAARKRALEMAWRETVKENGAEVG